MGIVIISFYSILSNNLTNFLTFIRDDDYNEQKIRGENSIQGQQIGSNPFLETPLNAAAIEYKKGYVMRKCCYDANNKKSKLLFLFGYCRILKIIFVFSSCSTFWQKIMENVLLHA